MAHDSPSRIPLRRNGGSDRSGYQSAAGGSSPGNFTPGGRPGPPGSGDRLWMSGFKIGRGPGRTRDFKRGIALNKNGSLPATRRWNDCGSAAMTRFCGSRGVTSNPPWTGTVLRDGIENRENGWFRAKDINPGEFEPALRLRLCPGSRDGKA